LWCIYITGPEPREATRLQLENKKEGLVAHLSATLCVHGDLELYRSRIAKLGPDPLRQDADKEVVWLSMQKTKGSIGAFLMDQSMIAGIGNIYRSELLLVTGIHPDHCASTVSRSSFESLWIQAKQLMEIGVQTGYIITILTDDTGHALPKKSRGKSHYVYNQKTCGRCHGVIQTWKIAQRTVYACEACQPPPPTISQSVTVKRRRAASICSTRLGRRDDTLDTEDTSVEDNVGMTVTTSKKRVAKGGRVVEHQAFKHISTGGLPDAFEIPGLSAAADKEDTEDSQNHVPVETTAAQMIALSHGNPCKSQTRQGEDANSNNQDKEQEAIESNLAVSKVTVERQQEHRSTWLQKKVEATNERITLGFRATKKRNT